MSRKGGRGLTSSEDSVNTSIRQLEDYVKKKKKKEQRKTNYSDKKQHKQQQNNK